MEGFHQVFPQRQDDIQIGMVVANGPKQEIEMPPLKLVREFEQYETIEIKPGVFEEVNNSRRNKFWAVPLDNPTSKEVIVVVDSHENPDYIQFYKPNAPQP